MWMDQEGTYAQPVHRLRVACSLPARLPCSAQAAHRRRTGVAHTKLMKQDCSSGCAHAPRCKRVVGGQAWPTHGPGVAKAVHRPGLGPSQAKCSDGRENLQEKYVRTNCCRRQSPLFNETGLAKVFIFN